MADYPTCIAEVIRQSRLAGEAKEVAAASAVKKRRNALVDEALSALSRGDGSVARQKLLELKDELA
jgi:hypothetical protein